MADTGVATTQRERFRFVGRDGDQYVWQSVQQIRGDSRYAEIRCGVEWFWNQRSTR